MNLVCARTELTLTPMTKIQKTKFFYKTINITFLLNIKHIISLIKKGRIKSKKNKHILWAYRSTPHSTIGELPFRLTYGTKAVVPIELNELNWRTGPNTNFRAIAGSMREEVEFVDEIRSEAALKELGLKQKIAVGHNKRVVK